MGLRKASQMNTVQKAVQMRPRGDPFVATGLLGGCRAHAVDEQNLIPRQRKSRSDVSMVELRCEEY